MSLNTNNPTHLQYNHGDIAVNILGGINHTSLDRLRVTLKITAHTTSIRHNLDLYNDNQLVRLIRKPQQG